MPAAGKARTRTEEVSDAIETARAALADYLTSADLADKAASIPLLSAQRELARATALLHRQPRRRPTVAVPKVDAAPTETDDLTRIRGIDSKAVERLAALGIMRFEQIAAWEPADVRAIGQALDLGRSFQNNGVIDQARMLLSPYETANDADWSGAFAGWRPHLPHAPEADAGRPGSPVEQPVSLTAKQLSAMREVLRQGPPRSTLTSLVMLVPGLASPVVVPVEVTELEDEAGWQPSPLMETATPVVEDLPAVDGTPVDVSDLPDVPPVSTDEIVRHAVTEEVPEAVASVEKPAHVVALDRIAALDAEISALGSSATETQRPTEMVRAPATDREPQPTTTDLPAPPLLPTSAPSSRTRADRRLRPLPVVPGEEAEVTISVRQTKAESLLQPLSELPLRPKQLRIELLDPTAESVEVSEAAVVIVKRRARERAAPDLEFYKGDPSDPAPTTTRRATRSEMAS